MSDLRTELCEPVFRMQYRVIYADTDAGGVVYYASYLRFFEMARTELMRSLSTPYSHIADEGIIIPVTECYVRYKVSARYDDLLTITASLAEVGEYTCRFHYRMSCVRPTGGAKDLLLVKGFTKHACIDRQGKLTPFPEYVAQQIGCLERTEKS